jgi:hypothetical protein
VRLFLFYYFFSVYRVHCARNYPLNGLSHQIEMPESDINKKPLVRTNYNFFLHRKID